MPKRDDRIRRDDDERPRPRRRDRDEDDERPRARRDDRVRDDHDDRPARRRRDREDDDYDDRPRRRSVRAERLHPDDLRAVATYQKAVILCIVVQVLAYLALLFVSKVTEDLTIGPTIFMFALYLTATVFLFLLAMKVYGQGTGIALAILTIIPCIGLFVLLFINAKATGILQAHDVRVGLLGANMGDLPRSRRGPSGDDD